MSPLRLRLAAATAIGLAIAGLAAFSLRDEELTPEASILFARPAPRLPARDSAWALLAGFTAPAGDEPRDYGPKRRRTVTVTPAGLEYPRPNSSELALRAADELLCAPESRDCTLAFAVRPDSIHAAAADNAVLLARYDELLRVRGLGTTSEGFRYDTLYAPVDVVMRVQQLRLSQIGVATALGRIDQALAWLEADAAFYRAWLEDPGEVLGMMLAVRGLTRALLTAGQVARAAPALTPDQLRTLERVTAPLTPSQRSIAAAVRAEAAGFTAIVDDLIASPRKIGAFYGASPFFSDIAARTIRRNATLNFAVAHYAPWTGLDAVATDALAPAIAGLRADAARHLEPGWSWAYNFTGHSVVAESPFDPGEYVYRLRDADALTGLVRCAVGLRAKRLPAVSAAAFVSSEPSCRDPYGARAFAWDPVRAELSFKPGFAGNVQRLGGHDGRVAFAPYPG